MKDWHRPPNLHELRSFLGLGTYYRRFVPNSANVAASLLEFTKKSAVYQCGESQEKTFILDSDASGYGIGDVISQMVNRIETVIEYYSHTLSKPERNYRATRRELIAVLECIKHYHKYLYGQHLLLRINHSALR